MELRRLTAKSLVVGIKNGMTKYDFCEKYECADVELAGRIAQIYSKNPRQGEKLVDQMEANEKIARKEPEVCAEAAVKVEAEAIAEAEVVAEGESELERLRALESVQSQEVVQIELSHKALAEKHWAVTADLRDINDELKSIIARYRKLCVRYESAVERDNEIIGQMNELSALRREKVALLKETRERIAECLAITLCVYASGEIVVFEEDRDIVLDDSGCDDLYSALLEKEECQELRLKDIRTLARLICIVRNLDSGLVIAGFMFDNEELEIVYQLMCCGSDRSG